MGNCFEVSTVMVLKSLPLSSSELLFHASKDTMSSPRLNLVLVKLLLLLFLCSSRSMPVKRKPKVSFWHQPESWLNKLSRSSRPLETTWISKLIHALEEPMFDKNINDSNKTHHMLLLVLQAEFTI